MDKNEIKSKIKKLQNELVIAKEKVQEFYNKEQALKLTLNSIYGSFGSEFFYFFNIDLAETVTQQGKDAILYAEQMINKYFLEFWHKDTIIHEKMGIKITAPLTQLAGIYIDTDSCFVQFGEMFDKQVGWDKDISSFILTLYNLRLKEYLEKVFLKYAKKFNTDNYLNFELEKITKSSIWLAKKKYVEDIIWTDPDVHYDSLTNIKAKGFEIVQSSTPYFARKILKEVLKFIFSQDTLQLDKVVRLLYTIKQKFKLTDIELLSKNLKISNYNKFIINDYDKLEVSKGCPIHIRGSAYFNYLINSDKKLKGKYNLIKSGDKVKMYYCKSDISNIFAYISGNFPYEIAPPIDYDLQFEKVILDPINRILKSLGLHTLDANLIYSSRVF